jgi:hypothetical protein
MRPLAIVSGAALLALAAAPARADVLSARLEAHVGGLGGASLSGAVADAGDGFFDGARGAAWGVLAGVEVMFIDVWIDHHQVLGAGGLRGTWTQFMAGIDLEVAQRDDPTRAGELGRQTGYFEVGIGLGFGVGTGQQPELPLDNRQLSDKGFVVEGRVGAGWVVADGRLGLGVAVPVSVGYLFKSGYANDVDNQYASVQGAVLLVARAKLTIL